MVVIAFDFFHSCNDSCWDGPWFCPGVAPGNSYRFWGLCEAHQLLGPVRLHVLGVMRQPSPSSSLSRCEALCRTQLAVAAVAFLGWCRMLLVSKWERRWGFLTLCQALEEQYSWHSLFGIRNWGVVGIDTSLFCPNWLPLSFSQNRCSPLWLHQELYRVASAPEPSVISVLSLNSIVFLENAAIAMR